MYVIHDDDNNIHTLKRNGELVVLVLLNNEAKGVIEDMVPKFIIGYERIRVCLCLDEYGRKQKEEHVPIEANPYCNNTKKYSYLTTYKFFSHA